MLALLLTALVASAAGPKLTCGSKELQRRDCRLMQGSYELRLLEKTLAWNDGNWHTVDPLPLTGEGIEWEKITFEIRDGRPLLQMWIWDKGVGEAQVQSLHWYVADAEKRKFTILSEGIVRKRRLKEHLVRADDPPPVPVTVKKGSGKIIPVVRPKYLYDAMESHSLKSLRGGTLEWTLGREKKIIEFENQEKAHGI